MRKPADIKAKDGAEVETDPRTEAALDAEFAAEDGDAPAGGAAEPGNGSDDAADGQQSRPRRRPDTQIARLLPNLLTLVALCAGLTAIRFGFQGDLERAVLLLLLAAVLDGMDGRLARLLKAESPMGAELDSLSDFVNFGVAPALIIYVWALQDIPSIGWISTLIFAICCVIRLARFNVGNKSESATSDGRYFVGVPAPAGAMLALLPMFISFLVSNRLILPPELICAHLIGIGLLMISRIPTWSFKVMTIRRERAKFVYVGAVILIASLLTYPWFMLVVLDLAYIAGVVWAWRRDRIYKQL